MCSCGENLPDRKETVPVTGEVYVDGQPAAQLQVKCHDVNGMDTEDPTVSSAMTGQDGKFAISTYLTADGVPEGEYVLTFAWGKFDMISKAYVGPDKLKARYLNPQNSEHRFKVEPGEPTDLERIELSTK
jgi:hypothetical protein